MSFIVGVATCKKELIESGKLKKGSTAHDELGKKPRAGQRTVVSNAMTVDIMAIHEGHAYLRVHDTVYQIHTMFMWPRRELKMGIPPISVGSGWQILDQKELRPVQEEYLTHLRSESILPSE